MSVQPTNTTTGSLFPDADLVDYVHEMYGPHMAERVDGIFDLDPENATGFGNSVRRSLTRELERHMTRAAPA